MPVFVAISDFLHFYKNVLVYVQAFYLEHVETSGLTIKESIEIYTSVVPVEEWSSFSFLLLFLKLLFFLFRIEEEEEEEKL